MKRHDRRRHIRQMVSPKVFEYTVLGSCAVCIGDICMMHKTAL